MERTTKLLSSTIGALVLGSASGLFTTDAIPTWYASLAKPWFNPPNWVFGPVWTVLYIMMGISVGLVWSAEAENKERRRALAIFTAQFVLNLLWSIVFFGLRSPGLALVEILLLVVTLLWCIRTFFPISNTASWMLVPYAVWVCFAIVLNASIVLLNH